MSSLRDYFIVHSLDCQGDSPSEGTDGKGGRLEGGKGERIDLRNELYANWSD